MHSILPKKNNFLRRLNVYDAKCYFVTLNVYDAKCFPTENAEYRDNVISVY